MTRVVRHGIFIAVCLLGIVLRAFAMAGDPGILWFGDSGTYLQGSLHFVPSLIRPSGYSGLLFLLRPFHSLTLVAAVQHLLGVASAVMIYALVWRFGARLGRTWLRGLVGTLAAAPLLLDGYQIQLEHLLMSDVLFEFLMISAVSLVLWRMSWQRAAIAGVLLAFGTLTRSVGMPLLLLLGGWLLLRQAGWRSLVAAAGAFAVPVLGYLLWFHAEHHTWELTRTDSVWLYGRTASFADCAKLHPSAELRPLCPGPPVKGVARSNVVMWGPTSPLRAYPGGIGGVQANDLAGKFAYLAITKQPLDYLRVVSRDTLHAFFWGHRPYPTAETLEQYRFPTTPRALDPVSQPMADRYAGTAYTPRLNEPFAGWMRGYQSWAWLPGPALAAALAIGAAGIVRRRGEVLLPWTCSVMLLVVPAATADFDYRYVLPAVPMAFLAAALTVAGWRRIERPKPAPEIEAPAPAPSEAEHPVHDAG